MIRTETLRPFRSPISWFFSLTHRHVRLLFSSTTPLYHRVDRTPLRRVYTFSPDVPRLRRELALSSANAARRDTGSASATPGGAAAAGGAGSAGFGVLRHQCLPSPRVGGGMAGTFGGRGGSGGRGGRGGARERGGREEAEAGGWSVYVTLLTPHLLYTP